MLSPSFIYVAERRIGVRLLVFDPAAPQGSKLVEMTERIQTPHYTSGVHVRINADGSRNLVVNDLGGGIHIYE